MLLEVEHLSKNFGGVKALNDVSIKADENYIYSIIGPNGAGKTTFFNVISGVYKQDTGKTMFDGQDITGLPQYKIARAGLGRTFQNIRLFKGLTVLESLMTSRDTTANYNVFDALISSPKMRHTDRNNREQCIRYLEMVGMESYRDEMPSNLSYGMQRRVELARALAMDPKLILLDEPAAGLNPKEVGELVGLIRTIREQEGVGFLIIEHRMKLINELSEYIYVLNFGNLLFEGKPEEVRNNPDVIKAYLGEKN